MKYSVIVTAYNQKDIFINHIFPALKNQTIPQNDFEVIIADDGSSDGLEEYCEKNGLADKYVYQEDNGYGYTSIVNKAVNEADGDFLVFLSGDTYPAKDFLEELGRTLKEDRIVNGIRVNINSICDFISYDWRLQPEFIPQIIAHVINMGIEMFPLRHLFERPWELMTMNTLACSRKVWDAVDGLTPSYDGRYGKMDWSFCMKAYKKGYGLWWNVEARGYTFDNGKPGREDDERNTKIFQEELKKYSN